MPVTKSETVAVRAGSEVVSVRHRVRALAVECGFSLVEQTKIVTAASELARNMVDYGRGGTALLEMIDEGHRKGLRLTFEDQGPGILSISDALRDGYSTGSGMGLGLGGAKRLSNEFHIHSVIGQGTRVTITRWRGVP
jgi:serine/threonine-protein kinase RsbT